MTNITDQLNHAHSTIARAVELVQDDGEATPALSAVVQELHRISHRALEQGGDESSLDQLEQAADSAKVAAQASETLSAETRQAIVAAHDEVRDLKRGAAGTR